MNNFEKERQRIRTEERTRISAKIVSKIGDLLLEDLENSGNSKRSGGAKSSFSGKKNETNKPQNFHNKNTYQKGNNHHPNPSNSHKKPNVFVNNGPRTHQCANQNINIYCSSNQHQTFHNKNSSGPKPSNSMKFNPQGKCQNSPAVKGPVRNQNANQHINVYCTSNQQQSNHNANSSRPKFSHPPGNKPGPKNNQGGNGGHSNYPRKQGARANNGPMPRQNANQNINIYCNSHQKQTFSNANSSGSKQSGAFKPKPQGNKSGAIKH